MDRNDEFLERALREAYSVEPPAALRARLMAIPEEAPAPAQPTAANLWRRLLAWPAHLWPAQLTTANLQWRLAVPACAVAAAIAVLWVAGNRVAPDDGALLAGTEQATEIERQQAIREFVIVMNYLQTATASAHRGVQGEIGTGLMTAFNRGEQSFTELSKEISNGG
ncbi:MAG TPA: hypothetical protein VKQ06_13905 [Gammaproteobacteria bacterium]|nr:hypothetical protein [Gammaproteobacteria bacterium]